MSNAVSSRRVVDAAWLTALPLLLNVVSVASTGYIIRQLGEAGWGILVTAMGLSGTTTILSNLGLRALYTRAVTGAGNEETEALMGEQIGLRTMLGALAGLAATGAAALLHSDEPMVIACTALQSAGVMLTIMWTVMADVLNARELFGRNARVAFTAGIVLTIVTVVAAAAGGGPVTIAAGYLIGPVVSLILLTAAVRELGLRPRIGGTTWRRYGELLKQARALAANDLLNIVHSRATGIWAPLMFSKALIGINDSGSLPYSRLGQVADGVATAYFPAMATAHKRDDEATLRHQLGGMLTLILIATVPLGIFTWYGAPYFAELLFPRPDQTDSVNLTVFVARVTCFAIPITALGIAIRYAMQASGLHSRNAKDQMLGTGISSLLTLALALGIGIKGLAIGLLLQTIIVRGTQQRSFGKRFPGLLAEVRWQRGTVGLLGLLAILELTIGTTARPGLLGAALWGTAAAMLYAGYLLWSRLIELPTG